MQQTNSILDVIIVGGGPAGMAAALVAGRARLRALVVSAETPRNGVAHASHGFLTRDGATPADLLQIAKHQLERYPTIDYLVDSIVSAQAHQGGFLVGTSSGRQWSAPRLIFANGERTELAALALPNLDEVYGRSVFPCPFCDGFEVADQPLAVFAWSGAGHAMLYQRWSNDIVVFTHGHTIPEETRSTLTTHGMRVETSPVSRLHHQDGKLSSVELRDGTQIARTAGFLAEPHAVPASTLPAELGVERTTNDWGMEHYVADDFGRTKIPGVYVIGDLKRVFGGVSAASHDGYQCAAGIVRDMVFSP